MKEKSAYLMVPRKLVVTVIVVATVLFIGNILNIQYTNYVFHQLCGLISISDDTYKDEPPSSTTGKNMAKEMARLTNKYHCK